MRRGQEDSVIFTFVAREDSNGILVIMAYRGEMTQFELHWLLHYNREWWKEEEDSFKNSFQSALSLVWLTVGFCISMQSNAMPSIKSYF